MSINYHWLASAKIKMTSKEQLISARVASGSERNYLGSTCCCISKYLWQAVKELTFESFLEIMFSRLLPLDAFGSPEL